MHVSINLKSHINTHSLSSHLMNNFIDIVFPRNGSVKDLSRLLSKLRYSLTHILWLTNSEAGEYRLAPVPLIVFDASVKYMGLLRTTNSNDFDQSIRHNVHMSPHIHAN
jgi:hypothetical protein